MLSTNFSVYFCTYKCTSVHTTIIKIYYYCIYKKKIVSDLPQNDKVCIVGRKFLKYWVASKKLFGFEMSLYLCHDSWP
jgi:hypothetical protein